METAMADQEKPKLELKQRTIYDLNYRDLGELVKKVYNAKDYNFVIVQECCNDSSHEFSIDGKIEEWEEEEAAKIRSGKIDTYNNYILMQCLCADGYIPPGDYIVDVCW